MTHFFIEFGAWVIFIEKPRTLQGFMIKPTGERERMHQFFFIDYLQSRENIKLTRQLTALSSVQATISYHFGCSCSTVVACTPSDQEVIGLNLTGHWALLFRFNLYLLSSVSFNRSLKVVQPIWFTLQKSYQLSCWFLAVASSEKWAPSNSL